MEGKSFIQRLDFLQKFCQLHNKQKSTILAFSKPKFWKNLNFFLIGKDGNIHFQNVFFKTKFKVLKNVKPSRSPLKSKRS